MTGYLLTKSRSMKCGCTCRDSGSSSRQQCWPEYTGTGTGTQFPESADCCQVCSDQGQVAPCAYIADFGLAVEVDASGNASTSLTGTGTGSGTGNDNISIVGRRSICWHTITLRHRQYFCTESHAAYDDCCKWVALGETGQCTFSNPQIGIGFIPCDSSGNYNAGIPGCSHYCCMSRCTWAGWLTPECVPFVSAYGTSWELDVSSSGATLTWDHHHFGLLQYQTTGLWVCDDKNTMKLVSHGSIAAGVLPSHICVTPQYDGANPDNCSTCYDEVFTAGYTADTKTERCNCCDAGLLCGEYILCDNQISLTRPGAGPDPVGAAVGLPFRGGSFTSGAGIVIYCTATPSWSADIYCDGVYKGTYDELHFGCEGNLVGWPAVTDYGFDLGACACPTPPCCGLDSTTVFYASLSGCYTETFAMTWFGATTWKGTDSHGCVWSLACNTDVWSIGASCGVSACSWPPVNADTAVCSPLEFTFTTTRAGDPSCPCTSGADTVNIVVTL